MAKEDIAVTNFREYLRIRTVHPEPDYETCKQFLFGLAEEIGITFYSCYTSPRTPFIIMTIPGQEPELPSLMLYSHTDVVPVSEDKWTYDPFSGYKDEEGRIYGRGTQDMKSVGIQYISAVRRHFQKGRVQWKRTIHLVYGPDEEISGEFGMKAFCESEEFKKLNVGFMLDEGSASPTNVYRTFYGEKSAWAIKIACGGTPGHGCVLMDNTAGMKLSSVLNSVFEFREEERRKIVEKKMSLGDVIAINLTKMEGGLQTNVVPCEFAAWFDIRIPPWQDLIEFEARIRSWCAKAGPDITLEFLQKTTNTAVTSTSLDDPWWAAFEGALKDEKVDFTKEIVPARTDAGFLRMKGYRAIGFSPMNHTPMLLHAHNEYLHEDVFLRGIKIYERVIDRLASV